MVTRDDVHVVAIATPSGLHLETTIYAAEAGKHIYSEKPFALIRERIDATLADGTNVVFADGDGATEVVCRA